jgi:ketosteroid isomerase-like protein
MADIVVASYDALNRGEVDEAVAALADDAEWHESGALPGTGVYTGRGEIRDFLEEFLASWGSFHQVVEEAKVAGDRVAVLIHLTATGRESEVEVDARYSHLWTMRGERAVRVDAYYDREAALAALEP